MENELSSRTRDFSDVIPTQERQARVLLENDACLEQE